MKRKQKQTGVRLTPSNHKKLEGLKEESGQSYNTLLNQMIAQYGEVAAAPPKGNASGFYTHFISVLEAYLFDGVERGIMEEETRQAAADFYEALVKELAKHTKAKAIIERMAIYN